MLPTMQIKFKVYFIAIKKKTVRRCFLTVYIYLLFICYSITSVELVVGAPAGFCPFQFPF